MNPQEPIHRRKLLTRIWQGGALLMGGAAAWTSWDLLQAPEAKGFGGLVRSVSPEAIPDVDVVEVAVARSYLANIDGDIIALSQKCTHQIGRASCRERV